VSETFITDSIKAKKLAPVKKYLLSGKQSEAASAKSTVKETATKKRGKKSQAEEQPKKNKKRKKEAKETDEEEEEEEEETSIDSGVDVTKIKPSKVLKGLQICISGTLSMKRKEFEDLIKKHGGTVTVSVSKKTTHLITTTEEVENGTVKVSRS